jgi:hypothetical protein
LVAISNSQFQLAFCKSDRLHAQATFAKEDHVLEGGCLCGNVRYTIEGDPIIVAHCYCRDCQRVSGAAHMTGAMFPTANIEITGPMSEFRSVAESGSTVSRLFCATCSSFLFGRNTGMAGFMTVSVGTLDRPDRITPQVAVFARSRPHWDAADANVQSFDTQPSWKPADGV